MIACAISSSALPRVPQVPVVMTLRQTQYAKHRPCHHVKPRCITKSSVVSTETISVTDTFTFLVALVRSSISCLPVTFWNSIWNHARWCLYCGSCQVKFLFRFSLCVPILVAFVKGCEKLRPVCPSVRLFACVEKFESRQTDLCKVGTGNFYWILSYKNNRLHLKDLCTFMFISRPLPDKYKKKSRARQAEQTVNVNVIWRYIDTIYIAGNEGENVSTP